MRRGAVLKALLLLEIHANSSKTLVRLMFAAIRTIAMPMGHDPSTRNKGEWANNTGNAYTSFNSSIGLQPQITFAQFITSRQREGRCVMDGCLQMDLSVTEKCTCFN